MVNSNSLFQVECVEIDQKGRFIVAKLDEDHSIVNIYAPTELSSTTSIYKNAQSTLDFKNQLIKS